ncbi:hypothetical protein H072_41 [Dactylellina haptotyla CBS 200.50]|uniref:Uncharacterized protein n=1 Tax=Dactylellina haptotyla (strain CBS 200.50) TaxID=1284197 RepID=S8AT00_DACHA|nr:hypothetical protein H072_41 [Dactylellina haptotyla CBS 200.50]
MENIRDSAAAPSPDFTIETREIDPDLMDEDEAKNDAAEILCSLAAGTLIATTSSDTSAQVAIHPSTPVQQSPTSPPLGLSDTKEEDEDDEENLVIITLPPPARPETPNPNNQLATSSPLSPSGSRRALQSRTPPRIEPPLTPQTPTGNKQAHSSNPHRYNKLRSKLRKDRERELMSQKGSMGTNKLEDLRIRERMVKQLRKNIRVPDEVRDAIKKLIKALPEMEDQTWRNRLEKFSFLDFCEMWRFQYLEPDEFIHIQGWDNTTLDDSGAVRYVIGICRQEAGLSMTSGG